MSYVERIAALEAALSAKDAEIKRLWDLCHRWNKMAGWFAAGSEFVNDPERVLEALKTRRDMEQCLREKTKQRAEAAEASLRELRAQLEKAQAAELSGDKMADRHWIAGAQFGWNAGATGDWKALQDAIGARQRDLADAARSESAQPEKEEQ